MNGTQALWADGRAVAAIRQARPADQAALGDFFAGLSARTRYLRFFGPVIPGPALLRLLLGGASGTGGTGGASGTGGTGGAGGTGELGARPTEARHTDVVVAVRGGAIIGHAMAADQADPDGAPGALMTDIGVVVADAWQGRGVGSALMRALVTGAQARGVTSIVMDVLAGNRQVFAMITGHWPAADICRSRDGVTVRVQLPHHHQQQPRSAARPLAGGASWLESGAV